MASNATVLGKFTLSGKDFTVESASFQSAKSVDNWNQAVSHPKFATLKVTLQLDNDAKHLLQCYADTFKRFDAQLSLKQAGYEGEMETFAFGQCTVTSYCYEFDAHSTTHHKVTIEISGQTFSDGTSTIEFQQGTTKK